MKLAVASRLFALLTLAHCASLGAQSPATAGAAALPTPPARVLFVPAGEGLVLELKSPLNSKNARKGDRANFSTTNEVLVGDQVAIPRGTTVRATVTKAKRAGRFGKPEIELEFNQIVLPERTAPLSANLTRAAWSKPQGEHSKAQAARGIASDAATGAIMGVIFAGTNGAIRGATAGAAIGVIGALAHHGPDLDFPPGMMFEVELTRPLEVSALAAATAPRIAASQPPPLSRVGSGPPGGPGDIPPAVSGPQSSPAQEPDFRTPPNDQPRDSQSKDTATVAANRTPPPPTPTADAPMSGGLPGGFKLKVDVDLVVVEATVRDERGAIVDNLKREDFHLYEDSVEQKISHFSRDELPLAVALVVDRSGSMGPVINELRRAAYDTLSLLKPDDQVALFAFAVTPERLEYLTTDRQRIADDIAAIHAGGGTNIADALYNAALYLGRAAPGRRHAVILVSDNENTVSGFWGNNDVIHLALETETAIYSIKVGGGFSSHMLSVPLPALGSISVPKIARESGGDVIDANGLGSVQSAMSAVIARLKQRYTLGYYSANALRDGKFRRIDIRIKDSTSGNSGKYSVYARRGYYARAEHTASATPKP